MSAGPTDDLAGELRRFMARTGTLPSSLSRAVSSDPCWVTRILGGVVPKAEGAAKIRAWMAAHPEGIKPRRRFRHVRSVSSSISKDTPAPVLRDPCPRCAVRGDIGCKHRKPGTEAAEITLAIWVSQPRREVAP